MQDGGDVGSLSRDENLIESGGQGSDWTTVLEKKAKDCLISVAWSRVIIHGLDERRLMSIK